MEILNQLLKETFTKSQLLRRIKEVEQYLNSKLFGGVIPTEVEGSHEILDKITANEFPLLIEQLKKSVDTLPIAILTTAIPLPDEVIQKIVLDLRKSTLPNLIIDAKVDPQILAGATIIYKGVVHDYSLNKKIGEQKDAILNSFKGYFK